MMEFVEKLFERLPSNYMEKTQVPYNLWRGEKLLYIDMKALGSDEHERRAFCIMRSLDIDQFSDEEMRKMLEESGHVI